MSDTIRFTGLTSGLDTQNMVNQLMRVENMRMDRLTRRRQLAIWRQEDLRGTMTRLQDFRTQNTALNTTGTMMDPEVFNTRRSIVTGLNGANSAGVTVQTTRHAVPRNLDIDVRQTAAARAIGGRGLGEPGSPADGILRSPEDLYETLYSFLTFVGNNGGPNGTTQVQIGGGIRPAGHPQAGQVYGVTTVTLQNSWNVREAMAHISRETNVDVRFDSVRGTFIMESSETGQDSSISIMGDQDGFFEALGFSRGVGLVTNGSPPPPTSPSFDFQMFTAEATDTTPGLSLIREGRDAVILISDGLGDNHEVTSSINRFEFDGVRIDLNMNINGNLHIGSDGVVRHGGHLNPEFYAMVLNPAWSPNATIPNTLFPPEFIEDPPGSGTMVANPAFPPPPTIANPAYTGAPPTIANPALSNVANPDYPDSSTDPYLSTFADYYGDPAYAAVPDGAGGYTQVARYIPNPAFVSPTIPNPAYPPTVPNPAHSLPQYVPRHTIDPPIERYLYTDAPADAPSQRFNINTVVNIDDTFESIQNFINEFNTLIRDLNTMHSTARPRNNRNFYEPLTDEQRGAMSDREVERWEEQARMGMTHRDQDIRNIQQQLRRWVQEPVTLADGRRVSLMDLGITTGYGTPGTPERTMGLLTIENEDRLRYMLENNSDMVHGLFAQHYPSAAMNFAQRNERMPVLGISERINNIVEFATGPGGTIRSRVGAESGYDTAMNPASRLIRDYDARIEQMHQFLRRRESHFFDMFSRMEQAMAQSDAQMDALWAFAMQ